MLKRSSAYGTSLIRKRVLQKALLAAIMLTILALIPAIYLNLKGRSVTERKELRDFFESGDFDRAYSISREMLREKPLDFLLLTIYGFSAYQLAVAQINNYDTLSYVNDCIWALRKTLLLKENPPEVFYVLGKAYFYKGQGYADLAVAYLEKARSASYMAGDIPEYLGLSYAAVRDYRSSIEAFTLALSGVNGSNPSDILLLSIARSYLALEENETGRAYLIRCLDVSRDSRTIATVRLLLAETMRKEGDNSGAEAEYFKILEEVGENAEARYQLGELYAAAGDTTRARAEWRRALRTDPAHGPARNRLNL